jgi:hypothetical protein
MRRVAENVKMITEDRQEEIMEGNRETHTCWPTLTRSGFDPNYCHSGVFWA